MHPSDYQQAKAFELKFHDNLNSPAKILYQAYLIAAATTFIPDIRRFFQSYKKLRTYKIWSEDSDNANYYEILLEHVLTCVNNGQVTRLPGFTIFEYIEIHSAADYLYFNLARNDICSRMERMANDALDAEDIKKIYRWYGSDHWVTDLVVNGVANEYEAGKVSMCRLEKYSVNDKIGEDFDEAFGELVDLEEE
jgi:hypothetical protein